MKDESVTHKRTSRFLLSKFEQSILPPLAKALPGWVKPDHLTVLGMIAATGIGVAYVLTNQDEKWIWAVNAMLIVHWFGDSLDGTLARVRRAERPRYGFYLDHLTDAYSTLMIGLGLGLSPYMTLTIGLSLVIGYFFLSINVYLETYVFGEFHSSYGLLGPTEVRAMLIVLNTVAAAHDAIHLEFLGIKMTIFDIVGFIIVIGMFVLLLQRALNNLKKLASDEPSRA